MSNPILEHSKMVWQEVHKRCKISQYTQKYASIWHNPKIKIDRQSIYWAQWLRKDIRIIDDLFENGNFLSYIRFKEKFNLEGRGHFWKYLQIRHCIKEVVPVGQDRSAVECYLPYNYPKCIIRLQDGLRCVLGQIIMVAIISR